MAPAHKSATPFWEKPLSELDRGQWEALCDGCGRCCLHKLEDEETGLLYPTNVACELLDRRTDCASTMRTARSGSTDCVVLNRKSWRRWTGCPKAAPIACDRRESRCPNGII